MRYVDLFIYNWVIISMSTESRFWAPWKMSYFPLTMITSFSGGWEEVLSTPLWFFSRPHAGAIGAREYSYHLPIPCMVHKPRFLLIKRKERNTNQKRDWSQPYTKKLIKSGQREFYMVWKISEVVHTWCLLFCFFFFWARCVPLFKN